MLENYKHKIKKSKLTLSEIITIVIMFYNTRYRTFKDYYSNFVFVILKSYFPNIVSYSRFVNYMKICLFPLFIFSQGVLGECTGISFIDSTILTGCHVRRINSHSVFKKYGKKKEKHQQVGFMDLNYI